MGVRSSPNQQPEQKMTRELKPEELRVTIDPAVFPFKTTADLTPEARPLGQERAVRAINFGLEVESHGYNLFVLGEPGAGKQSTVTMVVNQKAAHAPVPSDWVYVFNFASTESPLAIPLPPGRGEEFRDQIASLVKTLLDRIPKALADDPAQKARAAIFSEAQTTREAHFAELEKLALSLSFIVERTPEGITLTYAKNGEPVAQEGFDALTESEKEEVGRSREQLHQSLRATIEKVRELDGKVVEAVEKLDADTAKAAIEAEMAPLRERYADNPKVVAHLNALGANLLENLDKVRAQGRDKPPIALPFLPSPEEGVEELIRNYRVNVLVSNGQLKNAPVVFESNPTYHNLVGRMEHKSHLGAYFTDHTMIKPGAFHRSNGGYLVLNAREVLLNPFSYEALKRVLKDQEIRMEEVGEQYRLVATVSLKPEPIPTRLKVVLLGTPWLYYVLQNYDEDFLKLFKVKGELSDEMELSDENLLAYSYLIASLANREKLLPFGPEATARVAEHGLRLAEDQKKLSTGLIAITDLVREAHHWARADKKETVEAVHVLKAIEESIYRSDYLERRLGEMIAEDTIRIDVTGAAVGQANGLSVYDMGDYAFGKPSRVTARVHMGKEGLVNIERESDLGGPIHNKGVMILHGFFGARYAQKYPLSLAATVCFEQSYGGVEGDSASSTELFTLISAISGVPLRQDLAITGSVDQFGRIQPVGGVNLKIEGFYKTCKAKGLTSTQGVVMPLANVKNLMLDMEIVDAVKDGRFHIHPIADVDEGLELLTGMPAGTPDPFGDYPKESVNGKVMAKLEKFHHQWRKIHED